MKLKKKFINVAEIVDAWRIVPRIILLAYAYLVIKLYSWFITIPTYVEQKCDAALMKFLTDNNISLREAQELACTISDVVGGPTTAQSAFVTTIIGLSTAVFGLYASTGRKWENKNSNNNNQPNPPVVVNYPQNNLPTQPSNPRIPDSPVDDVKFEP